MKKLLLLVILEIGLAVLSGCDNKEELVSKNMNIIKIQGCEYIILPSAYGFPSIAHKGNCSNPIHIYNKPIIDNTEIILNEINKQIKELENKKKDIEAGKTVKLWMGKEK